MLDALSSSALSPPAWLSAYPLSFLPSVEQFEAARFAHADEHSLQGPFEAADPPQRRTRSNALSPTKRPISVLFLDDSDEEVLAGSPRRGSSAGAVIVEASSSEQLEIPLVTPGDAPLPPRLPSPRPPNSSEPAPRRRTRGGRKHRARSLRATPGRQDQSQFAPRVGLEVGVDPHQLALGPRHSPSALTSISPLLTQQQLFPHLGSLSFADYQPYLLDRSTEPVWPPALYNTIVRFLGACAPFQQWARAPRALEHDVEAHPLAKRITSQQPDKQAIQAAFRPRPAPGYEFLDFSLRIKFRAMRDVMRWMWQDEHLQAEHVAGPVRFGPLALHILVREFATILRFTELTQHSETALRVFLANLALPTPITRAAERLLDWLNTIASPDRHYLFFCRPDGALRCDRPWERWFERALSDAGATRKDLDEWERETLRVEDWEP